MTEWKTYKLGELIDRIIDNRGKSAPISEDRYQPIIEINSLGGKSPNYELIRKWVSKDTYDNWFRSGHPIVGDILIPTVGTIGIASIMNENRGCIAQNIIALRTNNKANNLFLYYYLKSESVKQQLLNLNIGGVQPSIKVPHLLNLDILLPSLEEQRRIAGILGAIDDKIENNRRINDNLEQQAQALYKQWFVDNRSDDWEVGKVSDYYDITIGKTPPRKEKQWFSNNPKDSVWVSISDMGSCGAYISDSSEYLTTKAVDKFNIKVVPNNTVLLSFKLTVGRVAISDGAMTTNEAIAHFNTLNDYLTEYTYLALKAYNFANLGSTSSIATAVNSKIIKSMLWIMPNDNVLRDFHNIVAPIFTQIKNNIRENETLATLRDTLLPKLMNGEVKL